MPAIPSRPPGRGAYVPSGGKWDASEGLLTRGRKKFMGNRCAQEVGLSVVGAERVALPRESSPHEGGGQGQLLVWALPNRSDGVVRFRSAVAKASRRDPRRTSNAGSGSRRGRESRCLVRFLVRESESCSVAGQEPHTAGFDLANGAEDLHPPLCDTRSPFGRTQDLANRPEDVALDHAGQPDLRRQPGSNSGSAGRMPSTRI